MTDVHPSDVRSRREALGRVRSLLTELGCSDDEIDRAVADDVVDLLVVDRLLVPAGRRLTQTEVAEITDLPVEAIRRLWRALGFLDVSDDDLAFTDLDIEAVELFQSMMAMGLADVDSAVQTARVVGLSMARIAEAETSPGSIPVITSSGDSITDADNFARQAELALPAMARLLEYVWRRHLQAAVRRARLARTRGSDEGMSPVTAVGFADMVGFTVLSQHLGDEELAGVVARFEELAHETVVALGGRVIKMIGDEVMFAVQSVTSAAEIGLSLAEAYADDELLSDVRVALAVGPALLQDGDYYGPVVNLASRLVGVAHPGTVLVSDEFRTALGPEAGRFDMKAIRPRTLKDLGRVQAWKLSRAGTEPGADRRRSVRWERLGAVLRELEELRDRGEKLVVRSSPRRAVPPDEAGSAPELGEGGSDPVEPDRGDSLGTEVEGSLERSQRSST
ncbi:MAG TPA: adenylate cyclase regulatory domain-containing protein [Acidimicrobiales bacterium]|nr:adenylate cyclase regulatory domain-containing protein [Acidimicrobiales bacterium]